MQSLDCQALPWEAKLRILCPMVPRLLAFGVAARQGQVRSFKAHWGSWAAVAHRTTASDAPSAVAPRASPLASSWQQPSLADSPRAQPRPAARRCQAGSAADSSTSLAPAAGHRTAKSASQRWAVDSPRPKAAISWPPCRSAAVPRGRIWTRRATDRLRKPCAAS